MNPLDYIQVPAGTYPCRIVDVRTGSTRAGDERWSLHLVVVDGPHAGRLAAWDSLVFSSRGRIRARMVLVALGLPAKGRVQVEPQDLVGRVALVEVRLAEYANPNGEIVRRNEVPFDGWRALLPPSPECGHGACRQNWIDTGSGECCDGEVQL